MTTPDSGEDRAPRLFADQALWRRDDSVDLVEHTMGSLLVERARQDPDALAVIGAAHGTGMIRRLTYAELLTEAVAVARALLRSAHPGQFVAIWAPNVIEWPIVQYGAALAGLTLVPLNPLLAEPELHYTLEHSGATVLIHADYGGDRDLAATVRAVTPKCPTVREVVSMSSWPEWIPRDDDAVELPRPSPDSLAMLQYTSGTTGTPKGVLLRHRALVNVAKLTMEAGGVAPGSVALNPLPMFHTAGCVVATLGPLWLGGCAVLLERFEPVRALEQIRAEDVSLLFCVPTILGALLEAVRKSPDPAPSLRTAMCGAANVPGAMIRSAEQTFGPRICNLYGQTELAPVLSMTRPGDPPDDLERSVGRPLPWVDCKIVDPATGRTQPLGVPGEICARGYQQFVGYLDDPRETARTVDADGWVHTGDLGSMDERGVLTLTGRLKELIIRGGENIAPAEVESCLAEHEAVLDAAVFGVPDAHWGETVAAAIRLRGRPTGDLRLRLEAHCRERLAPFKVPRRWYLVDGFPVTPTGKVRKFLLVEGVQQGRFTPLD